MGLTRLLKKTIFYKVPIQGRYNRVRGIAVTLPRGIFQDPLLGLFA